jgi:hypothetical protein
MRVVRGAVYRINDPFNGGAWLRHSRLFGQDGMLRIALQNAADDQFFTLLVRDGNEVRLALELDSFSRPRSN